MLTCPPTRCRPENHYKPIHGRARDLPTDTPSSISVYLPQRPDSRCLDFEMPTFSKAQRFDSTPSTSGSRIPRRIQTSAITRSVPPQLVTDIDVLGNLIRGSLSPDSPAKKTCDPRGPPSCTDSGSSQCPPERTVIELSVTPSISALLLTCRTRYKG